MRACVLVGGVGDSTKLKIQEVQDFNNIGETDVLIQHSSVGINFDDIMYRRGDYIIPEEFGKTPILGFEAVGKILRIGSKVNGFKVGDRVGYAFCRLGAYAEQNLVDYRYIFHIPDDITSTTAAGVLRKGLTAEYLLFKTFKAQKDDCIMIHSVAGGVGHLLAKWAKYSGLHVIGTVRDDSKVSIALSSGIDYVINREKDDILKKVTEYTNGKGVRAVYDGIGKPVFEASLNSIKPFGFYISYGYSGGKLDAVDVFRLREKSLFFSAPVLELYMANRYELILSAANVFEALSKGIIMPNISKYGLEGIPQAHTDLESGNTTGSLVVNVD